jgi:hypothetical protein
VTKAELPTYRPMPMQNYRNHWIKTE